MKIMRSIILVSIEIILTILMLPVNIWAQSSETDPFVVVSLGDSYSSGEGIPNFYGQGDNLEEKYKNYDWLAHRSTKSWPSLIELPNAPFKVTMANFKCNPQVMVNREGYNLNYDEEDFYNEYRSMFNAKWYFVASSGAKTYDINYEKSGYKGQPKEVKQVVNDNGDVYHKTETLPRQLDIFDYIDEEVDYVTLTVGGNDVDFKKVVATCAGEPYYITRGTVLNFTLAGILSKLDKTLSKIKKVYYDINERIDDQTYILVAGYPKLFDRNGKGTAISKGEAQKVNECVNIFNRRLYDIVKECQKDDMRIRFVDVEKKFDEGDGHAAYSDDEWINGILSIQSEDLTDFGPSAYSIHPNEQGARAYADCINAEIRSIEIGASVSGVVVDKNDRPAAGLTVTISTPVNNKVMFSGMTDSKGEFIGNIDLMPVGIRVNISDENGMLYDTVLNDKTIEPGINDLGKFELDNYEGTIVVEIDEQAALDKEDISDADPDKGITALLQDYVTQRDFMYGKSYKYTLYPFSQYNPEQREEWEGVSPGQSLGYSIEDFDDDGDMELLILTLTDGYHLQFDMYEVMEGNVTLSDSVFLDSDDGYPAPQIPNAESYDDNLCGILSCCVSDDNHRIYLQSSDTLWVGGGEEIFVVSVIYKNNVFSDYKVSHLMCNGLMEFERIAANQELSDMGVPNPDIDRIFYEFLPVVECFDGGAHEILHAEQHGIDYEMMDYDYLKVVSQTDFFANDNMTLEDVSADDSAQSSEAANYLELYAELLGELRETAITPSRLVFQLIYLDDDEFPELVVTEGGTVESQAWLYSFKDGKVSQIFCNGGDWGNHGSLYYIDRESIVLNAFTTVASGNYAFYRIEDGQATFLKEFSKKPSTDGSEYSFYVGGNPVSQEDYEKQYDECGGSRLIAAGYYYGTVVSQESIQLLLRNDPICYRGEGGPF